VDYKVDYKVRSQSALARLYNFISHSILHRKNKGEDIVKEWTVNAGVCI